MADDKKLCFCMGLTESEVREAIISKNLKTVEEVGEATKAGTGCGGCQGNIQHLLDEINK